MDEQIAKRFTVESTKALKRKALGLCGRCSVKTLDEMAQLLVDTKIAQSIEEGRELAPHLDKSRLPYDFYRFFSWQKGIEIDRIESSGEPRYQIKVYSFEYHDI